MGLNLGLPAIPRFDQSLLPWLKLLVVRLDSAFNRAAIVQETDTENRVFAAAVAGDYGVTFKEKYSAIPHILISLVNANPQTFPRAYAVITRCNTTDFDYRIISPVAYTGTLTVQWIVIPA